MLKRWIPDEDWVRRIRDNGENDCTLVNFNMGMSTQCSWQNNHAILKGQTIFYNKKKIRLSKINKSISFYYVLSSARMPAPNVPSDQAFYQSLWDDPERSKRSLKRTAPSQQANQPPTT